MSESRHIYFHRRVVAQRRAPQGTEPFYPGDHIPGEDETDGTEEETTTTTAETTTATSTQSDTSVTTTSTSTIVTIPSTTSTTDNAAQFTTLFPPTGTSTTSTLSSSTFTTTSGSLLPPLTGTGTSTGLPSPSTTAPAETNMSTGLVLGSLAGGVAAIAIVGYGAAWLMRQRRARRQKKDPVTFEPSEFRRSAMLLNDPPSHKDSSARDFEPQMTEARSYGGEYTAPGQYDYGNDYSPNYPAYQNYGQGAHLENGAPSPMTGNPFSPSPFSPVDPGNYYDQQPQYNSQSQYPEKNAYGQPMPSPGPTNGPVAYPALTRQTSDGQKRYPGAVPRESAPVDDYVDLNRSSVSPYQAAKYVEISQMLNVPAPPGLPFEHHAASYAYPNGHGLNPPTPEKTNPFSDPSLPPTPTSPTPDTVLVPPSPAYTTSSRRIDSTPPRLPELQVDPRVSVNVFEQTGRESGVPSPLGSGFPTSTYARSEYSARVPQPSPLASSFGTPTPHAGQTHFDRPPLPQDAGKNTRSSVYDDSDAYGGI